MFGTGISTSHGTIIANIAAGDTCGVAPEASISIFSTPNELFLATMIAGMEKMLAYEKTMNKLRGPHYSVLNCSWRALVGDDVAAHDDLKILFNDAAALGVYIVAAAGNNGVICLCSDVWTVG